MQQCNCNQCGTSIEVADGINFVTCRNCQTSLKIHRTEYVVYTEVVENQQNNSNLNNYSNVQNLPQDTAKQEREQAQAELHLTYRKLDALNDEWRIKYPNIPANSESLKKQYTVGAVVIILFGLLPFLPLVIYYVIYYSLFSAWGEREIQVVIVLSIFNCLTVSAGVFTLSYARSGKGLVGLMRVHEQKQAAIEQKIAELEQKLSQL